MPHTIRLHRVPRVPPERVCKAFTGGHLLRGTDALESMGPKCTPGHNVYINLEPDTRAGQSPGAPSPSNG